MKGEGSYRPTVVSLFCGCGGLDKGFEMAGFKTIWANDFDKDAQNVFRLNIGEVDSRDIRNVPVDEIPDCDVITAGFPCQPFSAAGKQRGVYDSRGELYLDCIRIINAKRPKVVLFENVKGLLSAKHQTGKALIDVISDDIEALGYHSTYQVMNASDYNVPQNRKRLILVAIRKDVGKQFVFPTENVDKSGLTLRCTISNIPKNVPNQKHWPFSPQAQYMTDKVPPGGSWKDIPYDELPLRFKRMRDNMRKLHSPVQYKRFRMDEICGTITASAQPERCGIIHPTENRRYTIREIARIQSFPDDYIFIDETPRDIRAMYKVIGNAVPCLLASAIANEIMAQVFHK